MGSLALPEDQKHTFLGTAISRYDVDELDELGKKQKREQYVEVKRPDGTVAKSRGERTFYGAFTGGFSAGHWGTVGSKEGWEPAAFVSSRSKRGKVTMEVEDIMDEEDLQEHRASHSTITARGAFAERESKMAAISRPHAALRDTGLSEEVAGEVFGASVQSLGSRLLKAGSQPRATSSTSVPAISAQVAAAQPSPSASSSATPKDSKPKRRLGPAPRPNGWEPPKPASRNAGAEESGEAPGTSEKKVSRPSKKALEDGMKQHRLVNESKAEQQPEPEEDLKIDSDLVPAALGRRLLQANATESVAVVSPPAQTDAPPAAEDPSPLSAEQRHLAAELERYWQMKCDMHGVGYGQSQRANRGQVDTNNRLYMSSKKGKLLNTASGYGEFGTGILERLEEGDVYEDWICDEGRGDRHLNYHMDALKDAEVEAALALEDVSSSSRNTRQPDSASLPGFVKAERTDEVPLDGLAKWRAPKAPRMFRGIHASQGTVNSEAQFGSTEHRTLLEFLGKHGDKRIMDPGHRAELLGEKGRGFAPKKAAPAVEDLTKDDPPPPPPSPLEQTLASVQAATKPLWKGMSSISEDQKNTLLKSLGRSFLVGEKQDMDGASAKHAPFKREPAKQERYVQFCLALEGKVSATQALGNSGGLNEAARHKELEEFGRVYRSFRTDNPNVDIHDALDGGDKVPEPVIRRTLHAWRPDKLLCKRWGVPQPSLFQEEELPGVKRQREYERQVQVGIDKIQREANSILIEDDGPQKQTASNRGIWEPPKSTLPASIATGVASVGSAGATSAPTGDLQRPPQSLFTSIFGNDSDDD